MFKIKVPLGLKKKKSFTDSWDSKKTIPLGISGASKLPAE